MHPVSDKIKVSLPRTYRISKLSTQEITQIGHALITHADPAPENEQSTSARKPANSPNPTKQENEDHWATVKPQLVLGYDLTPQQRTELMAVPETHCFTFSRDKGDLEIVNRVLPHH